MLAKNWTSCEMRKPSSTHPLTWAYVLETGTRRLTPFLMSVAVDYWLSCPLIPPVSSRILWIVRVYMLARNLGIRTCSLAFFFHWKGIALNTKKWLQKIIPFKGNLCILFSVWTQSLKCSVTCTAITHLVRSNFRTSQLPIILAHFLQMHPTAVVKLQFS